MHLNSLTPEQYHTVFRLEKDSEYNLKNFIIPNKNTVDDYSLIQAIKMTRDERMVDFLTHYTLDSDYDIFIFSMLQNRFEMGNGLQRSKLEIVNKWIEEKTGLNNVLRRSVINLFLLPNDINKFSLELEENTKNLDSEDVVKYLKYGKKLLTQQFNLHDIKCGSSSCIYYISHQEMTYKIDSLVKKLANKSQEKTKAANTNPDFTIARQVLALYYLLEHYKFPFGDIDKTALARFTQFLTGRHSDSDISNTNIYSRWKKIHNKTEKKQKKDLVFIKQYFIDLQLYEVAKMIDNDIKG